MNEYTLEGNICLIKPRQLFLTQIISRKIAFCFFIMNPTPVSQGGHVPDSEYFPKSRLGAESVKHSLQNCGRFLIGRVHFQCCSDFQMWKPGISEWMKGKRSDNCANEHLIMEITRFLRSVPSKLPKVRTESRQTEASLAWMHFLVPAVGRHSSLQMPRCQGAQFSNPTEQWQQIFWKLRESPSAFYLKWELTQTIIQAYSNKWNWSPTYRTY